jgi:hypothetical protein
MSVERDSRPAFPERECAVCGRKGGGAPDGGLDNVSWCYGQQLCGHHTLAFYEAMDAICAGWATKQRAKQTTEAA